MDPTKLSCCLTSVLALPRLLLHRQGVIHSDSRVVAVLGLPLVSKCLTHELQQVELGVIELLLALMFECEVRVLAALPN
jgi:hypothetical protein